MTDITRQGNKLVLLEIGRAIAAMIVVLHHADQATAHFSDKAHVRLFMWGQYGVDFFFVLSGFIIFHVHRDALAGAVGDRLAAARLYAFKRVARIYVPYLPIALGWMVLLMIFQSGLPGNRSWSILATLTLAPMAEKSALTVAWTLTYEMIFYTFFGLVFFSRALLWGAGLFWCGWLLAVLGSMFSVSASPVVAALSNPIILDFFCGALAALVLPKLSASWRPVIAAFGIFGLLAVMVNWSGQRVHLGPPLALIVLAAAMNTPQTSKGHRVLDWLAFLGAASYAIYLVHSPVVSILAQVLQPLDNRILIFAACVIVGTALGVLYHLMFERPALRWAQQFRPVQRGARS